MKPLKLTWVALALLAAACTGAVVPDGDVNTCDDPPVAVAELPGDVTDPAEVDDGNCGGGNDPDGTDPDNPGKGHDK